MRTTNKIFKAGMTVIIGALVLAMLFTIGQGNAGTVQEKPETVSETHYVTSIGSDGYVHGENVNGSGEGIYYHLNELTAHAGKIIKGDIITIEWLKSDYTNEVWDNIQSVSVEEEMNSTMDYTVEEVTNGKVTVKSTISNKTITFPAGHVKHSVNEGDVVEITFSPSYELLSVNGTI